MNRRSTSESRTVGECEDNRVFPCEDGRELRPKVQVKQYAAAPDQR